MKADKLRAEYERFHAIGECRCTISQRLVGDGCMICNPAYTIELLEEDIQELETQILELTGIV